MGSACSSRIIRLARDATADDIAQRQRRVPLALGLAQRSQGVCRLARLRDSYDDRIAVNGRIAIAKLRGILDLDRDAGKLLEQVLAHERRVIAGTAGRKDEAVGPAKLLGVKVETAEVSAFIRSIQPAAHGVFQGLRLLIDLLEHVVFEGALVSIPWIPVDL